MKFKNLSLLISFLFLTSCSDQNSQQQSQLQTIEQFRDTSQILAVVNNNEINQVQFDLYKQAILLSQPNLTDQQILAKMINFELISQKAKSENLDKTSAVQAKLRLQENELLSDLYIKQFISKQTGEIELKREYEQIKNETDNQEILLRHIMADSESEILLLLDQIKKSSFEQVANSHNENNLGGLVGWITTKETIPAIRGSLERLANNTISEPIQSEFGWHLVRIDDRRKTEFLDFDEVKTNLQAEMINKKMSEMLDNLKSNADIEILANFANN